MCTKDTGRPSQPRRADEDGRGVRDAELSGVTLNFTIPTPRRKSIEDVNTPLRGGCCPLCSSSAHCVRASSRMTIWRCDAADCGIEFGRSIPGRLKDLGRAAR